MEASLSTLERVRDTGHPIVTRDKPAGVHETYFQAIASTLIYGVRDAVLVDAFATVKPSLRSRRLGCRTSKT